jgi:hypothetical protein
MIKSNNFYLNEEIENEDLENDIQKSILIKKIDDILIGIYNNNLYKTDNWTKKLEKVIFLNIFNYSLKKIAV